jgi:molecular chaperone GrpE (heat shock protein)
MTKEQFKAYICNQIDLMDESQLREFTAFIQGGSDEESIAEELIIIKGEFKKLTKLVQSMGEKIDRAKNSQKKEELLPFIEFDSFLKNSKDAVDSLPKATLFSKKRVNRSIKSLQNGFSSVEEQYEKILTQIGLKRCATVGDRFDSNLQEVVEVIEDKNMENGIVVEILEDGFLYNNEIINYAKVKVNRWTL